MENSHNKMNQTIIGDCRATMRSLIRCGVRVQCCVTSPPYYGLRDYGHSGQIGLETTPEDYVDALVDVFECVRDLLTDDGVLWLNLGDCYATSRAHTSAAPERKNAFRQQQLPPGLRPKNLIGIPWRVAFALQASGWLLRQDIIWHKPNPMPESVTDRCTNAHEYLFLLSKNEQYFFDQNAIKEGSAKGMAPDVGGMRSKRDSFKRERSKRSEAMNGQTMGTHRSERSESAWDTSTRNRRSVWTVPTQPYRGAHFAVFPAALIEPCVLAGSRTGDVVLDPFMGSGTVAQVAQKFGRQWMGCEINPEYAALQDERTAQNAIVFT